MEYWLSATFSLAQYLAVICFLDAFFIRKHKKRIFWGVVLFWIAFSVVVINLEGSVLSALKAFLVPVLFLGLSLMLYQGNVAIRIFIAITIYAIFNTVAYACEFGAMSWLQISREAFVSNRLLYTTTALIGTTFMLLISILVKHFCSPCKMTGREWIWPLLIMTFPFITILILLFLYGSVSDTNYNTKWMTSCLIGLIVFNIIVIALFNKLQQGILDHKKLLAASERVRSQEESLDALSAAYSAQRKIAHDFRMHITVLQEFLYEGKVCDAQNYLMELEKNQTERILLINTHNATMDAILNQKGFAAKQKDIDIHFKVNDLSAIQIKSTDCTVVLGNLLDNAIEACTNLSAEDRWIQVQVIYNVDDTMENSTLFISVLNPSSAVKIINGEIKTTKPDPALHGFGLPNVKDILSKYNADYVMSYSEGCFLFSLELPAIKL